MADPPVAELEQVADGGLGPALDVEPDGRVAAALGLDHHDRLGARRRAGGGSTSNSSSPSAGPARSASADAAPQSRSLFVSISATA